MLKASTNPDALFAELEKMGIDITSWSDVTHQANINSPAEQLESLVELPDVVYFDAAADYSISEGGPS